MNLENNKRSYISVTLCNDKDIQELNLKHRGINKPTDVLSFNIDEDNEDGAYYLGDVIVNIDQARRQAKDYKNSLEKEISELVQHGVLHLLGVNHEEDNK